MVSKADKHPWGGSREGAGRVQQNFRLKPETARVLRELARLWQAEHPEGHYTPARILDDLVYMEAMKRGLLDDPKWQAVIDGQDETATNVP